VQRVNRDFEPLVTTAKHRYRIAQLCMVEHGAYRYRAKVDARRARAGKHSNDAFKQRDTRKGTMQ
jgi:hypothetical protein